MALWNFTHNVLGMHLSIFLAIVFLIATAAVFYLKRKQFMKAEESFEAELTEKLSDMGSTENDEVFSVDLRKK